MHECWNGFSLTYKERSFLFLSGWYNLFKFGGLDIALLGVRVTVKKEVAVKETEGLSSLSQNNKYF